MRSRPAHLLHHEPSSAHHHLPVLCCVSKLRVPWLSWLSCTKRRKRGRPGVQQARRSADSAAERELEQKHLEPAWIQEPPTRQKPPTSLQHTTFRPRPEVTTGCVTNTQLTTPAGFCRLLSGFRVTPSCVSTKILDGKPAI